MTNDPGFSDYYDHRDKRTRELEDKLYDEFPEIEHAAEMVEPPVVHLRCPKGHPMLSVTLHRDHNWHLCVEPADTTADQQVASAADPLGTDTGTDWTQGVRVRFNCPRPKCSYSGVHGQDRLLKLYAVALRFDRGDITLPS